MATSSKYLNIDAYRDAASFTELAAIRRTLAKRANQRLVRLERAASAITGERYDSYGAAEKAFQYLKKKKRFSESVNAYKDINKLRREITVLQGFLSSESSTVQGQRAIERRRVSAFERGEWGAAWKLRGERKKAIRFASNKEFYDFLNSETFRSLIASGFTSDQIIEMFETYREEYDGKSDEVIEAMEEALQKFRDGKRATLKSLAAELQAKKLKRKR